MIACGKHSYAIVTNDNNMLIWGNVICVGTSQKTKCMGTDIEGFSLYNGYKLFDGGVVKQLEIKYDVFGALVQE